MIPNIASTNSSVKVAVEQWLKENAIYCQRRKARISINSCRLLREKAQLENDRSSLCFDCLDSPKQLSKKEQKMGKEEKICTVEGCILKIHPKAAAAGQEVCYRHWRGKPHLRKKVVERTKRIKKRKIDSSLITKVANRDRLVQMFVPSMDFIVDIDKPKKKLYLKLSQDIYTQLDMIVRLNQRHMRKISKAHIIRVMIADGCNRILEEMGRRGLIAGACSTPENGEGT